MSEKDSKEKPTVQLVTEGKVIKKGGLISQTNVDPNKRPAAPKLQKPSIKK